MKRSKTGGRGRKQVPVFVAPDESRLVRLRARLTPFEPLDLRELVETSRAASELTPEKVLAERTGAQLKQLLAALGFVPDRTPDWSRAFYALAEALLGLGHVRYAPRRQNRSAAKWDKAEASLLSMIIALTKEGLSERQAINRIASDPEKWKRLPYREQGWRIRGGKVEQKKRAAALHRHLQRIKARRDWETVFGPEEWPASRLHQRFLELELGKLAGKTW